MRFDLLYEVGFRLRAYQFINHFAALDEKDSGDAGYAVIDRQLRIMVYIDLPNVDTAIIFFGQFLYDGTDCPARSAPLRRSSRTCTMFAPSGSGLQLRT